MCAECKVHLGSLYELIFDSTIDTSYFYGLSSICHHIKKITVIGIKVYREIAKLIQVQKYLTYFEWKDDLEDKIIAGDPYKEIFCAIFFFPTQISQSPLANLCGIVEWKNFTELKFRMFTRCKINLCKFQNACFSRNRFYDHV
jgi:hypothetical protein